VRSYETLGIVLLSEDYLPNAGGIAAHVAGLAKAHHRAGHDIAVVVPGFARNPFRALTSEERVDGFRVIRSREWRWPSGGRYGAVRRQTRRLGRLLDAGPPDVIHWHTPGADRVLAVQLPGSLRVFTNHTSHFLEWMLEGRDPARARWLLQPADVVICPSTELVEATIAAGFAPERTYYVANGVDTTRFSPSVDGAGLRREWGCDNDDTIFLCPRRLEKKNGVPYWLRAIGRMRESAKDTAGAKFVLVGAYGPKDEYSDVGAVEQALQALGANAPVVWKGGVAPDQMPLYMAAADVVVLPSLMEATSIAGLEAMASGKALVGTDVGGIPQIVTHGDNGLLVPPADADALADAMLALHTDAARRRGMGRRSRERAVHEFSWEAGSRQVTGIYTDALVRLPFHAQG
jgi:glycosyltransferase involved in cell wall biosynthesis